MVIEDQKGVFWGLTINFSTQNFSREKDIQEKDILKHFSDLQRLLRSSVIS